MKIAVTAASGQLGSAIVRQLIQDIGKEQVIAIARTPEKALHLGVEVRKGDYNSREDFDAALQGVDAVLIVSGMDEPLKRIDQHRNIIEAAKGAGVKKVVYTSISGNEEGNSFSPIVASNRQTENDLMNSGLNWVIGRNNLYIEPDLEYIDAYVREGGITNCAADGKASYTSRNELARAYSALLREDKHNGQVYAMAGEGLTQAQLANEINKAYGTQLSFRNISAEEYTKERQTALGEFLGTVIGGIYVGIADGAFDVSSDFEKILGRPHLSLPEMIKEFREEA